jgi:hypothetical protein
LGLYFLLGSGVAKGEKIAIGSEQDELALSVELIDRASNIFCGEGIELWFEHGIKLADVFHINLVGQTMRAGQCIFLFENAHACDLALQIGVAACMDVLLESEDIGEEVDGTVEIRDGYEGSNANEVRQAPFLSCLFTR